MSTPDYPDLLSRTIAGTHTLRMVEFESDTIFQTPLEERFERVTRMARRSLRIRIAAITILDDEKEWFKSVAGWNVSELPLQQSLTAKLAGSTQVCVVSDLTEDHRFWDHPLVVGKSKLRFYANYPLHDRDGNYNATFCVFDTTPRDFSGEDLQAFIDLGEIAQTEMLTDQRNVAVSELISKLGLARRAALIDPLTRVWNRQGAYQVLQDILKRGDSENAHASICMLDVDRFKSINDTLGHPVGDEVLRKLAAILVQGVRPEDIVCRVGGDEFLLVLPEVDKAEAANIVERIHATISKQPIRTRKGNVAASVSIGYVTANIGTADSANALIEQADQALLACKREGRDRVQAAR